MNRKYKNDKPKKIRDKVITSIDKIVMLVVFLVISTEKFMSRDDKNNG